jgi:hypothetical protein
MKSYFFILITLVLSLFLSCQNKFNKEIWLKENELTNYKSKRVDMTQDLIDNHLNIGMLKSEVIHLLGKPYNDSIKQYIPRNLKPPDSLNIFTIYDKEEKEREKYLELLNQWREKNYKTAPILTYYSGWSLIDPNFLTIRLDSTNKVADFWLEQH